jgi:uncharacterized protein YndB with AHSA1/START domain
MTQLDGRVERTESGGFVVAFDRLIEQPPESVWAAITDPKVLVNWLGEVETDCTVGGPFIIRFRNMSVVMSGRITALEPGRLIEYSWLENYGRPESIVRWEVSPAGTGCRLKLTHRFSPEFVLNEIIGFAGGWHRFLDAIPLAATGAFVPYQEEESVAAGYRKRYAGDGALEERGQFRKLPSVRFERLLPGPIERAWEHLTRPELLAAWFGEDSSIEARRGGAVRLMGGRVRGTITEWAPPHRLGYTWNVFSPGDSLDAVSAYPQSYLMLNLEPRGEEVLLVLEHLPVLERFEKQNAMGWHTFIDILSDTLTNRGVRTREQYMTINAARYGVDLNNLVR